jgi:hypothetical protein
MQQITKKDFSPAFFTSLWLQQTTAIVVGVVTGCWPSDLALGGGAGGHSNVVVVDGGG